ncbi:MAG: hypothetical protein IPP69_09270 [Flavobacteriales bacterium]|nr:hypothetical protein [Flavobacteriales bacterium]
MEFFLDKTLSFKELPAQWMFQFHQYVQIAHGSLVFLSVAIENPDFPDTKFGFQFWLELSQSVE